MTAKLTLGPLIFHWPAEQKRDFYFRIADEADVDTVYIGETICSKRTPFFEKHYDEVEQRLKKGGKKVVYSTLSEVMIKRDRQIVEDFCNLKEKEIEVNDASALWHIAGKPHRIGQLFNVYNEDVLSFLVGKGAYHACLPVELPSPSIKAMGEKAKSLGVSLEVQVFGRMPLALSARCYHARAHGKVKATCQFVCEEDPDGMDLNTLDGKPFLSINGIQTLSYTCLNLIDRIPEMSEMGVDYFRISPQSQNTEEVIKIANKFIASEITQEDALNKLEQVNNLAPFANGFYHADDGYRWTKNI